MTVILKFKNGYELDVHCEEAEIRTDEITGKFAGVEFRGIVNNKPMHYDPEDILCVYKLIDGEEPVKNKRGGCKLVINAHHLAA